MIEPTLPFASDYLEEVVAVARGIRTECVEAVVRELVAVRVAGGRVFFLGVGGGAGNASHAVNDFRKIVGLECYAPTDNVSELTARINDDGWESVFADWLRGSRLCNRDALFVFSVGGGDAVNGISVNLVRAVEYGQEVGARILGIVGRDGGYTAKVANACVVVPTINSRHVTAHTESF